MKIFADNNVRQGVFRILHEFGHEGETAQQNNLECLSNGTLSAELKRFVCISRAGTKRFVFELPNVFA